MVSIKNFGLLITMSFLASCATPGSAYEKAKKINYEDEISSSKLIKMAQPVIAEDLKDPDSLKNLKLRNKYKCFASNMGMFDNVTPKYEYGYRCYEFTYQAKNSYGGYVRGEQTLVQHNGKLHSVRTIGETVRKSDDVWTYFP